MKNGTLCYIRKDGKTLMIYRNKREKTDFLYGNYIALGGKHKKDDDGNLLESDEECAIREVLEEGGLKINNLFKKATIYFRNEKRKFNKEMKEDDFRVVVYFSDEFTGTSKDECKEGTLEWIADESILDLPMQEGDKLFTGWLYDPKISYFEAEIFHDGGTLVNHTVTFRK